MANNNLYNKVLGWFTEPFIELADKRTNEVKEIKPQPRQVSISAPIERPQNWEGYIGQTRAKKILQTWISGTNKRGKILPHIIIYGQPGCGKTTLANIIAKETNKKMISCVGETIKDSFDIEVLVEETDGGILFIDEIHSIPRTVVEGIYPLMEDFVDSMSGKVKPFTLIGATTEIGEILKDRKPFFDRFKIPIELEDYTLDNLKTIVKNSNRKMFPNEMLPDTVYETIAKNCRLTPRIAKKLMESCIYFEGDLKAVLDSFQIVKDGFTETDIKILNYLNSVEKPTGVQALCAYLKTSDKNYMYQIEPFLLQNRVVIRTARGRTISEEGKALLREVSNKNK